MQTEHILGRRYSKLILISAHRHQMISLPYWQTQKTVGVVDLPSKHPHGCSENRSQWRRRCGHLDFMVGKYTREESAPVGKALCCEICNYLALC